MDYSNDIVDSINAKSELSKITDALDFCYASGKGSKRIVYVDLNRNVDMRLYNDGKKGFASILVDLDLVTRDDTDSILLIKQESKRRFILDFNSFSSEINSEQIRAQEDAKKIERLTYENNLLKTKLREILKLNKQEK